MLIAIDFDATLVKADRPYDDVTTPLEWIDGAKDAVLSLHRAGHTLLLFSARTNRSLLYSVNWDPLVAAGLKRPVEPTPEARAIHWARYFQMLDFLEAEVPGVLVVDPGLQGKPTADVFIDDRALAFSPRGTSGYTWTMIRELHGAD